MGELAVEARQDSATAASGKVREFQSRFEDQKGSELTGEERIHLFHIACYSGDYCDRSFAAILEFGEQKGGAVTENELSAFRSLSCNGRKSNTCGYGGLAAIRHIVTDGHRRGAALSAEEIGSHVHAAEVMRGRFHSFEAFDAAFDFLEKGRTESARWNIEDIIRRINCLAPCEHDDVENREVGAMETRILHTLIDLETRKGGLLTARQLKAFCDGLEMLVPALETANIAVDMLGRKMRIGG